MPLGEAQALADRLRAAIRTGVIPPAASVEAAGQAEHPVDLRLSDVATSYLDNYARVATRRAHAVRQFEIYVELLVNAQVPGPAGTVVRLGTKPFASILRADLDAVFAARLAQVEDARQAAREIEVLRAEGRTPPVELRKRAAHAGRSTKGGQVGLNRFKARVRHLFNWAIAQGYRDDTPFKRHGVNVLRLNGAAETVRARRLQPGEEERLLAAATPHLRALVVAALSTGCRLGELLTLQWRDTQVDAMGRYRALILRAGKTKTGTVRIVPVGQRLSAVLDMLRTDPAGEPLARPPSCSGPR